MTISNSFRQIIFKIDLFSIIHFKVNMFHAFILKWNSSCFKKCIFKDV